MARPAIRLNVRRVTLGDAWQVGDVLARSYADSPAARHCLPDVRQRDRALRAYLSATAQDVVVRRGEGYLARIRGIVVGAALWIAPGSTPRGPWDHARHTAGMLPARWAGRGHFREMTRVGSALEAAARTEDGWYLYALGVEPRHQGRGIGARLLAPILEAADARGLTCGLHTSDPVYTTFFARFGFVVVDELHPVVPGGPAYLRMRRQPR